MDAEKVAAFKEKAEAIHSNGLKALQAGVIKAFPGFENPVVKADIQRRFGAYTWYSVESQKQIRWITRKIRQAANLVNAKVILAGMDFPLHNTLNEIKLPKEWTLDKVEMTVQQLRVSLRLETIKRLMLQQPSQTFPFFALDGANTLLLSLDVPDSVFEAREEFLKLAAAHDLSCAPFPPLWHKTASRLTEAPAGTNFQPYIDMLLRLKEELEKAPVSVEIGDVYFGTPYAYITGSAVYWNSQL